MKKVKWAAAVLTAFLSVSLLVSCAGRQSASSGQQASSSSRKAASSEARSSSAAETPSSDSRTGGAQDSPDAEVVFVKPNQRKHDDLPENQPDYHVYNKLSDLEAASDVIAECLVKEKLEQRVSVTFNPAFEKEIPSFGLTTWGVKVTKAYKGDPPGLVLAFHQPYCVWVNHDGKKLRICSTSQMPVQVGQKYLLFLKSVPPDDSGYMVTGDYQGKYAIPSDELKAKGLAGTVTQSDLDMYDGEIHPEIQSIYKDIVKKYFS